MTKLRILIAEDHVGIAENIAEYLEVNGHSVDFAYDGKMAVNLVTENHYDAIVMDIMMPRLNGYQASAEIRRLPNGDTPILMLTAKDRLDDKLEGFGCGADDYIIKPFAMAELHARILAHAGKRNLHSGNQRKLDRLTLDYTNRQADFGGRPVKLNPTTFKILWKLIGHYPDYVEKSEMVFLLWGGNPPDSDLLRSHIYNLRKQLKTVCSSIEVKSKHSLGYGLSICSETPSTNSTSKP